MVFQCESSTEQDENQVLRVDSESDIDGSDVEDDFGSDLEEEEEDVEGEEVEEDDDEVEEGDEDDEVNEEELDDDAVEEELENETNEVSSEDLTDEDNDDEDDTLMEGNSGWADAMNKVLAMGKNTDKPVSVLSKAKKDNVKKKKKKESEDGKEKEGGENSSDSNDEEEAEEPHIPVSVRRAKKREIDSVCRVKPDITKRALEKTLSKIATRGVVQLFNAVREQQKNVKSSLKEAGNTWKREKILKNLDKDGFLAVLDGKRPSEGPVSKRPKTEVKELKEEEDDTANWSALKPDYMLGAKMKDWDKESDEEI
ncbi:RRP15-like protein [Eurytemora carolleeae]|uniref:RRP15-like protein n=1 Tax=Eurytemora carolleeae TaxID=1294199 RepID=UPI000C75E653|nr:RRP15-like protein [Eurytemora carolleeae]|eukprot:XP_023322251.1 RRP15-like protein [Eurytemora affinis]